MSEGKTILSKEPWWEQPPKPGQTEADLRWGYLLIYDDRSFEFLDERPSEAELQARSSCLLPSAGTKTNKQAGFSIIQMVLAIGLMSFMTIQIIPYLGAWQEAQLIRVTRHGIEQLAQAAVAFRAAQHDHQTVAVWPADKQRMVTDGFLPVPETRYRNSVGNDYELDVTAEDWLVIRTDMLTTQQALKVAAEWGSFATVNGVEMEVIIAIPGQESSHSELVQLDGFHNGDQQVIRGPLHWDTTLIELDTGGNPIPTRDAIDLGVNDIERVRNQEVQGILTVQNTGGTALIDADAANIQILTATDFRFD